MNRLFRSINQPNIIWWPNYILLSLRLGQSLPRINTCLLAFSSVWLKPHQKYSLIRSLLIAGGQEASEWAEEGMEKREEQKGLWVFCFLKRKTIYSVSPLEMSNILTAHISHLKCEWCHMSQQLKAMLLSLPPQMHRKGILYITA